MRDKLQDTDALIATGRGDTLVDGHTTIEMARLLRERMSAGLGDAAVGLGHLDAPMPTPTPPPHPSPWKYAVVMSVASAVTGWVLEEIARRTFRKRKEHR